MTMLSIECERTRRQFDAYLSEELLVETTSEVLRHVERCEACSQELESQTNLRDALRRAVTRQALPIRLQESVHQRLRKAQPRFFRGFQPSTWAVALAAFAVLLTGVVIQQSLNFQRGSRVVASVLSLGVSDHLHCAIQSHAYRDQGRPPEELREGLGTQYEGLLEVVQKGLPGFQVLEAHQCRVPGSPRRYVHFIASGRGTILSVILTKKQGESLPNGRLLVASTASGVNLYKAHLDGMNVAGFEPNDYLGYVVADLGENDVMQIAAGIAPAIRNALRERVAAQERKAFGTFFIADQASSYSEYAAAAY